MPGYGESADCPVEEIDIHGGPQGRTGYLGTLVPAPWRRYQVSEADVVPIAPIHDKVISLESRDYVGLLIRLADLPGGNVPEALQLYEQLRSLSRHGRRRFVVVHMAGWIASTASFIALAGDYVVIDPAAQLVVHSMVGPQAEEQNRQVLDIYLSRTMSPIAELTGILARDADQATVLSSEVAVSHGWADQIGSIDEARKLAARLAAGERIETKRREALSTDWRSRETK